MIFRWCAVVSRRATVNPIGSRTVTDSRSPTRRVFVLVKALIVGPSWPIRATLKKRAQDV
jgi:hypothetical protein